MATASFSSGFLFLAPSLMPSFFGLVGFVSLFAPLPLIFSALRLGASKGGVTALLSLVLVALVGGTGAGVQFVFEFGLLALVLAFVLVRRRSVASTILTASVIVSASGAAAGLFYSAVSGVDPLAGIRGWIDATLTQILDAVGKSSVPAHDLQAFRDKQQAIGDVLFSVLPALVLVFFIMVSFLNLMVVNRLFEMRGFPRPVVEDLTRWRSPEKLVWLLIAAGFATLVFSGLFSALALNMLILLGLVYFFQGLAIVAHFLRAWRVPGFAAGLCYFMVLTQLPLTILVAIAGLFDLWGNFRRL